MVSGSSFWRPEQHMTPLACYQASPSCRCLVRGGDDCRYGNLQGWKRLIEILIVARALSRCLAKIILAVRLNTGPLVPRLQRLRRSRLTALCYVAIA
jgi:hypothetical protein